MSTPDSPCRLLEWDSELFGRRIGRVVVDSLDESTADAIDRWCRHQAVECVYFFARPDDDATVALAEKRGYHLADVRLTLARRAAAQQVEVSNGGLRDAGGDDLPALREMARQSYRQSRFYYDPVMDPERCDRLHQEWIQNCVLHGYAQRVIVAQVGAGVGGFITCNLPPEEGVGEPVSPPTGSIGLVAVSAAHRGLGLGRVLVLAALDWFYDKGAEQVEVATQARNIGAQRLYQAAGFRSRSTGLVYHYWIPRRPGAP